MSNNLFLCLCQQAEKNQSLSLARYLTWRSHAEGSAYTARLFDDDKKGLQLIVNRNMSRHERMALSREDRRETARFFDLSEAGEQEEN